MHCSTHFEMQLPWETVSADGMIFFACLYICKYDIVILHMWSRNEQFSSRLLYNNHELYRLTSTLYKNNAQYHLQFLIRGQ